MASWFFFNINTLHKFSSTPQQHMWGKKSDLLPYTSLKSFSWFPVSLVKKCHVCFMQNCRVLCKILVCEAYAKCMPSICPIHRAYMGHTRWHMLGIFLSIDTYKEPFIDPYIKRCNRKSKYMPSFMSSSNMYEVYAPYHDPYMPHICGMHRTNLIYIWHMCPVHNVYGTIPVHNNLYGIYYAWHIFHGHRCQYATNFITIIFVGKFQAIMFQLFLKAFWTVVW